jgi:TfoX/Sxy family transcriptional regulator of competence genes
MDRDFLIDLFADFGPVTIRKMFSGYGISADGTNFALSLRAAPMTKPFRNSRRRDRSRFSIRRGPRRSP